MDGWSRYFLQMVAECKAARMSKLAWPQLDFAKVEGICLLRVPSSAEFE